MNDILPIPPKMSRDLRSSDIDLGLTVGSDFLYAGMRLRLDRIDLGGVDLRNLATNAYVSVQNKDGSTSRPTKEWMRAAYAEGLLTIHGPLPENANERQARYLLLDATIADEKDGKARWRFSLASRAIADEIKNADKAAAQWLNANFGRQKGDFAWPMPSPSSLRRWMRRLKKGGRKVGALVSQSGRPRNHSQLPPEVDALVTQAALYYYAAGEGVTQVGALAYLKEQIDRLNSERRAGLPDIALPSRRTLQLRIDKNACFATWEAKYGREAAIAKFTGAGEPLLVDHFLQLCLMDATELEQIIVFDDDYQLPVLKTKITIIMDCLSHAIIGWHVYAGPNRSETSAQAYLHCFEPNKFPDDKVAEHPELAWCFGRPAALLPDNEKALIGPETLAGYNEAGTTIIPAPVAMPTAKAALERFIRTLKDALAHLPGTLLDPRRAQELGFEAIEAAAELTIHQLRVEVAAAIADHNATGTGGVPGLSPAQIAKMRSGTRATPVFEDVAHVRAVLCRTFPVFVTRNGVEKDAIRYRDAAVLDRLLDNNRGRLGGGARRSHGFEARGRRNDGNIDKLEVYDEQDGKWVLLPSTQPLYTAGLSFWEHKVYMAAAKKRNEPFQSQSAKLKSKIATRKLHEERLPKSKFRVRAKMAALALSEQVVSLAGKRVELSSDVPVTPQDVIEFRTDDPTFSRRRDKKRDSSIAPKPVLESFPDEAGDDDDWDDADFEGGVA